MTETDDIVFTDDMKHRSRLIRKRAILADAFELVEDPKTWAQEYLACYSTETQDGTRWIECGPDDHRAKRWCALGAAEYGYRLRLDEIQDDLQNCGDDDPDMTALDDDVELLWTDYHNAINVLAMEVIADPDVEDESAENMITSYNDAEDRTHDEIIRWFRGALESVDVEIAHINETIRLRAAASNVGVDPSPLERGGEPV